MVIDLQLLYLLFRISFFVIFVGVHIALMLGTFLEWQRDNRTARNNSPEKPAGSFRVSIVIPVCNESGRMGGLLNSLRALKHEQAELIFVDDRSRDESAAMIKRFIDEADFGGEIKIITLTENPGPNYKQFALARGVSAASGEFLFFTDADCEVPPTWIEGMVKRFYDERVGAAIGPVLKRSGGKGFFHLYQCFEHAARYLYLVGATGLGAAGGGFGNNLVLRKSCLDAIGGYDNVPPSPTEDAALISKIRAGTKFKIRAAVGEDVHVITQGEADWKNLITQTLRWNNGGLFCPDPITRLNYNFLMIIIGMGILAIPFLPFVPSLWPLSISVLTGMIFNTVAILSLFGVSLPRRSFCFGYLLTLLFTPVYFTFLTIMGYLGIKAEWKGKKV